jgi:hypothetical protein
MVQGAKSGSMILKESYDVIKVISRKSEQKKNFQESNLWPHVSFIATLALIFLPEIQIKIYKQYKTVYCVYLMHTNTSY